MIPTSDNVLLSFILLIPLLLLLLLLKLFPLLKFGINKNTECHMLI